MKFFLFNFFSILFFAIFILIYIILNACLVWLEISRKELVKNSLNTIQFFLPILKPDLNDAHIEACVLRQLFSHVPCWFRTGVIRQLESFELLCRDSCSRPFIRLIAVYTSSICQFWNPIEFCIVLSFMRLLINRSII